MSEEETLSRHYDRNLDGITWKEDLNLLATSVVWSIAPLIINIVTLPFETAATLLRSVVVCLSGIGIFLALLYQCVRHGLTNIEYLGAFHPMIIGIIIVRIIMQPLISLLSLSCIIIRSIPFVGHALRMGYKLIDGQYKINPVESLGAQQPRFSPASAYGRFTHFQYSFSTPQPEAEINTNQQAQHNKLVGIYNDHSDLMIELSTENGGLTDNDSLKFCDVMSALYQNKEYCSRKTNTLFFNARSTTELRVDAVTFIADTMKDQAFTERLRKAFQNAESCKEMDTLINKLADAASRIQSRQQVPGG